MKLIQTAIPEVLIVEPPLFSDARGSFTELHRADHYGAATKAPNFVQDNLSRSKKSVLRGLHFQNPKPQGKLVTVLRGAIYDVAVDIRIGSPTFGKHVAVELNEQNRHQCWIPRGFAHGFVSLSETADVFYKCDEFYAPGSEHVLRWDDPELAIDWPCAKPVISPRDECGLTLRQLQACLPLFAPG